ncbi:MAG: N-6 DNA methylase [Kiritimatiellae bacterium]|nr:N-6 DNA methylase [Kiritimatiellia bacterium]
MRIVKSRDRKAVVKTDAAFYSRLVHRNEIAENDFNLSVSTYVEQKATREKIDIAKLKAELGEIVARETALRAEIDKIATGLNNG